MSDRAFERSLTTLTALLLLWVIASAVVNVVVGGVAVFGLAGAVHLGG